MRFRGELGWQGNCTWRMRENSDGDVADGGAGGGGRRAPRRLHRVLKRPQGSSPQGLLPASALVFSLAR